MNVAVMPTMTASVRIHFKVVQFKMSTVYFWGQLTLVQYCQVSNVKLLD